MIHKILRALPTLAVVSATSVVAAQGTAAPATADQAVASGDERQREAVRGYLNELDARRSALKLGLRDACDTRDRAAIRVAERAYRRADRAYERALRRVTTTRDPGLIAGGATFVAVGGASIVTSAVFGLMTLFSGASLYGSGSGGDGYAVIALATLANGVASLGAGIPMLTVGLKRQTRDIVGEAFLPRKEVSQGVTLSWGF